MDISKFYELDDLSQKVLINRLCIIINEKPPFNLNDYPKEIQAVYDELNTNEEDPESYFTLENCVVFDDGEIGKWVDGRGYKCTGCFVNDELIMR